MFVLLAPLRDRNYRFLLIGSLTSYVGANFTLIESHGVRVKGRSKIGSFSFEAPPQML
jgi:hypothetical protein